MESITITIDPEFKALIPTLEEEEYQQLAGNIRAEGCRDALCVWYDLATEQHVLIDGHNRYEICEQYNLLYDVREIALEDRDAVIEWIVVNQLGRRNLTTEQKSYFRGKKYLLEKKRVSNEKGTNQHSEVIPHNERQPQTAERLAAQHKVSRVTIERDGEYAEAVDTLAEQIRQDLRAEALQSTPRTTDRVTKHRTTKKRTVAAARAVKTRTVELLPFMKQQRWKGSEVLRAIEILAEMPKAEHTDISTFLDQPGFPSDVALEILSNLKTFTADKRQTIYALANNPDPREQSIAKTMAMQAAPRPDPQVLILADIIRDLQDIARKHRQWLKGYGEEPWSPRIVLFIDRFTAIQSECQTWIVEIETAHQERIASYA